MFKIELFWLYLFYTQLFEKKLFICIKMDLVLIYNGWYTTKPNKIYLSPLSLIYIYIYIYTIYIYIYIFTWIHMVFLYVINYFISISSNHWNKVELEIWTIETVQFYTWRGMDSVRLFMPKTPFMTNPVYGISFKSPINNCNLILIQISLPDKKMSIFIFFFIQAHPIISILSIVLFIMLLFLNNKFWMFFCFFCVYFSPQRRKFLKKSFDSELNTGLLLLRI